jgi:hypothetical protein
VKETFSKNPERLPVRCWQEEAGGGAPGKGRGRRTWETGTRRRRGASLATSRSWSSLRRASSCTPTKWKSGWGGAERGRRRGRQREAAVMLACVEKGEIGKIAVLKIGD